MPSADLLAQGLPPSEGRLCQMGLCGSEHLSAVRWGLGAVQERLLWQAMYFCLNPWLPSS